MCLGKSRAAGSAALLSTASISGARLPWLCRTLRLQPGFCQRPAAQIYLPIPPLMT